MNTNDSPPPLDPTRPNEKPPSAATRPAIVGAQSVLPPTKTVSAHITPAGERTHGPASVPISVQPASPLDKTASTGLPQHAAGPAHTLMVTPPRDLSRLEHEAVTPVQMPAADMSFVAEEQAGMIAERKGWVSLTIAGFLITLVVGVVMAHFTELEEITQGPGRVIPLSKEQVVQSLEGGILKEMLVREGDIVQKGQLLLKLDPTKASSNTREGENRQYSLMAQVARLRAEANGTKLKFPEVLKEYRDIVKSERDNYKARVGAVDDSIAGMERSMRLMNDEIAVTKPMSEKGLIAVTELLRLQRQVSDLRLQIADRKNKFRADAATELSRVESELAQVSENVTGRKDIEDRTQIKSPIKGTVKNVSINTVGGVVQPGSDILVIIPLEEQLIVEARIKPADVAFVRPGLKAVVKITAYEYNIYGGLEGTVEYISPDTLRDDRARGTNMAGTASAEEDAKSYYRITIKTKTAQLTSKNGEILPITPGMVANVEVKTGTKTVLDYILKPVLKMNEAFRER